MRLALMAIACALLMACQSETGTQQIGAEVEALRARQTAFAHALQTKDQAAVAAFYDMTTLIAQPHLEHGRLTIDLDLNNQDIFDDPNGAIAFGYQDFEISGDLAVSRGECSMTRTNPEGRAVQMIGFCSAAWRRRDGVWRVSWESRNLSPALANSAGRPKRGDSKLQPPEHLTPAPDSRRHGPMPDTAHRKPKSLRAAIVYDFDGTLARGNLQERSFIPDIAGMKHADFWMEVKRLAKAEDADEILVYMHLMLDRARAAGHPVTRKQLQENGADPDFFDGLDHWFDRIDAFGDDLGLQLDHYIVSSGIYEMIEGCPLFPRFRNVFASRFLYDKNGEAKWPSVAINYTTKTQFLFRINKGVENVWDTEGINRWMHNDARELPFERMIFIGDGDTDIPSMKMVSSQGGCAIAVLDPYQWTEPRSLDKISRLISEDRVNYVAPADYQPKSQLDVIVKGALGRIALRAGLPVST